MSKITMPNSLSNQTINNISSITPMLRGVIINHKIEDDIVIYTCKLFDEQTGETWFFDSRFSEFYQLNNAIVATRKVSISDLPKFPKKKLWSNNKDPQLIIKRRRKLEAFLNHILKHDNIRGLECVQNFIKRSKREFQIFSGNKISSIKQTVNLSKDLEKNFLDEIDSSMGNSDFLQIMERYEEYEKEGSAENRRIPSKFLNDFKRQKAPPESEIREENVLKLQKVEGDNTEKTLEDIIDLVTTENPPPKEMNAPALKEKGFKEDGSPIKSIQNSELTEKEKVHVVYMSPMLKIERSGSIKKQERMQRMETKYPGKRSFFKSYFGALCGACSD